MRGRRRKDEREPRAVETLDHVPLFTVKIRKGVIRVVMCEANKCGVGMSS